VAQATVAADFHKPLYAQGYFSPEITFHLDIFTDRIPQPGNLVFRKVPDPRIGIDSSAF
jgi:hypothetical protein